MGSETGLRRGRVVRRLRGSRTIGGNWGYLSLVALCHTLIGMSE